MSEEVPADVEMAPATEETPQKLPVPKESDLPIEDIDDIDEVSYFFLSGIWINSNLFFFFEVWRRNWKYSEENINNDRQSC